MSLPYKASGIGFYAHIPYRSYRLDHEKKSIVIFNHKNQALRHPRIVTHSEFV